MCPEHVSANVAERRAARLNADKMLTLRTRTKVAELVEVLVTTDDGVKRVRCPTCQGQGVISED